MIYELNNKYYMKKGTAYQQMDVIVRNTIILTSTNIFIDDIAGAKEYTYNELKSKLINTKE